MAASIGQLKNTRTGGGQVVDVSAMKPKDQVRHLLQQNSGAIRQALPKHISADRLLRVAQTAVTTTPGLLDCYIPSLLGGVMQCAQLGLEPNTVLGHAYLIPFKNRKKGRTDVQVIVGYKGLIDLARRSGQIVSIAAHAVREQDHFQYLYGLRETLDHRPADGERGRITHFYAVAHMKDGGHAFEVMPRTEVDSIMKSSQSAGKYGPWKDHYEEMGRKTAARRLAKWLPLSIEMGAALALDAKAEHGEEQNLDGVLDGDYEVLAGDLTDESGESEGAEAAQEPQDDVKQSAPVPDPPATQEAAQASQEPEQTEEKPADSAAPSANEIAAMIERAANTDELDVCRDAIGSVAKQAARRRLVKQIEARATQLGEGGE